MHRDSITLDSDITFVGTSREEVYSYKNHFRGDLRQAILKRFRMSESQLSQTRTKLKNKGWLDEMLVTSVVRSVQKEFRKMIQKGDTDNTIHLTFA